MDHWKAVLPVPIHEVDYEETVTDLESVARRLVAACGLAWEPACLEFHRTERPVRTASVMQVRQPVYQRSVARWKNYEPALGELFAALPLDSDPSPARIKQRGTGAVESNAFEKRWRPLTGGKGQRSTLGLGEERDRKHSQHEQPGRGEPAVRTETPQGPFQLGGRLVPPLGIKCHAPSSRCGPASGVHSGRTGGAGPGPVLSLASAAPFSKLPGHASVR